MMALVFKPSVEMTFFTADADYKRFVDLCRKSSESVLSLDLSKVTQCDSAGLAFLFEARRLARQYNKSCVIEGISQDILALAEFCGVEEIIQEPCL